jgi:hypothetical protein
MTRNVKLVFFDVYGERIAVTVPMEVPDDRGKVTLSQSAIDNIAARIATVALLDGTSRRRSA